MYLYIYYVTMYYYTPFKMKGDGMIMCCLGEQCPILS